MIKDRYIFIGIYLTAVIWMLVYNINHPIVNDGLKELETYLINIDYGWEYRRTLVNSSLFTTYFPALIQQATHLDPIVLFRVFPCLFYPLAPAFTYLISRRYLDKKYAMIAVLVVLFNSHILFFPDMGRVGVAFAFIAGLVWALLEDRPLWASLFSILIVFTHYSSSIISIGLVGFVLVIYLIRKKKLLKTYVLSLAVLIALTGLWHFGIAGYSGWVMVETATRQTITGITGDLHQYAEVEWLEIGAREQSVQMALGIGIDSIPRLIEVIMNWIVVILIALGSFKNIIYNKAIDIQYKLMVVAMIILILLTIAVPFLSAEYNAMRVYFTSLCLLSICLPVALISLKKKKLIITAALVILLLYGSTTSGLIYKAFGIEKTFPVYYQVEWRIDG